MDTVQLCNVTTKKDRFLPPQSLRKYPTGKILVSLKNMLSWKNLYFISANDNETKALSDFLRFLN